MRNHLDFIRIRGLVDSNTECFQGLGSSSSSFTVGGSGSGSTPALEWGNIPDEAITLLSQYTQDINDWLQKAEAYDPDTSDRGLPAIIGAAPLIPSIVTAIATGGASLPALAVGFLGQAIMNLVGTAIGNYAASLDPNSPQAIMKKAWLYKDGSNYKSILQKAFLYDMDSSKNNSALNDRLKDLRFNDEEIDFGAFRVWLRGKMIEY